MATIVQRPTPTPSLDMAIPSSPDTLPQRRARNSVEIIDVDLFEETADTRPAQRRRVEEAAAPQSIQFIELLDSDDDEPRAIAHVSSSRHQGSSSGSSSRHGHSRRYVSPLPPPLGQSVPPVPSVPRRYSAFTGMVSRTRSTPPSNNRTPVPGPIRPLTQPFILLPPPPAHAHTHARVHPHEDHEHGNEPRPAPPARHNPPMGFGGALISTNNARLAAERLERQRRSERRAAGGRFAPLAAEDHARPRNFLSRMADYVPWGRGGGGGHLANLDAVAEAEADERTRADAQLALDLYLAEEDEVIGRFTHPARGFAQREVALLRSWRRRGFGRGGGGGFEDDVDYKPEWTHPGGQAESGFVYDFAPSELVVPAEGKGKGREVVIDVDAAQERGEGVSSLLVCARCLDPLVLRQDGMPEEEARRRRVWGLRCGHLVDGKCLEELRRPAVEPPLVEEEAAEGSVSGKGKGKAREEDEFDPLFDEQPPPFLEPEPAPEPIRARLRSRHAVPSSAFEIAVPRVKKPRKSRKPKKPVVEARTEWACPVEGCGRVHVSEWVDGVWGESREGGAIGVFA